jgi:hypothetical protein
MVTSVRYVTLLNISVANIQTFVVAKRTQRQRKRGKVLYLQTLLVTDIIYITNYITYQHGACTKTVCLMVITNAIKYWS